jgi:hypothetical protein
VKSDCDTPEQRFRNSVAKRGGICNFTEWKGARAKYSITCVNGHACNPVAHSVTGGQGYCKICAGTDPFTAEQAFRANVTGQGGKCLFTEWHGALKLYPVQCVKDHVNYVRPNNVKRGITICRTCTGRDPIDAEKRFREIVTTCGGKCIYENWNGTVYPHAIECALGHINNPYPTNVLRGVGICGPCSGKVANIVYAVSNEEMVKFGITSNSAHRRLNDHKRDGLITVHRQVSYNNALQLETTIRTTLRDAGKVPSRGREYFDITCLPLILDVIDSHCTNEEGVM